MACDPPLEELGATGLASRSEVLDSDIVSLHVPLTRKGPHATWHMIGSAELAAMRESAVLVNSARGDVVDGTALRQWLESGGGHAALDCWPGEPDIDAGLLAAATVASPHVAGYSVEGKRRGTVMIYDAFCRRFGIRAWPVAELPEVDIGHLSPSGGSASLVTRAVLAVTGIERDDAALRGQAGRPGYFDALRRDYPPRREFQAARVDAPDAASEALLHRLGFRTKHTS